MTTWLLVHSPLLGPGSWASVAAELAGAGRTVQVPDLRPALDGGPGYAERQAALAAAGVDATEVVLAAHSSAGPLLPAITAALAGRDCEAVRAVFVDAGLPHPGRSRRSTQPAPHAARLDSMTVDGILPPRPRWWPAEELAQILPDPALRDRLTAEAPPLPAGLYTDPFPDAGTLPPAAYL